MDPKMPPSPPCPAPPGPARPTAVAPGPESGRRLKIWPRMEPSPPGPPAGPGAGAACGLPGNLTAAQNLAQNRAKAALSRGIGELPEYPAKALVFQGFREAAENHRSDHREHLGQGVRADPGPRSKPAGRFPRARCREPRIWLRISPPFCAVAAVCAAAGSVKAAKCWPSPSAPTNEPKPKRL